MITVIMPVYNEGETIYDNVTQVDTLLTDAAIDHRFLLVDDGSTDATPAQLDRLVEDGKPVSYLTLSRNFGKEAALCAGLEHAGGDAVVIMDADLQHPPALIPEMVRLWQEEGFDVVEGVKADRGRESVASKVAAMTFYRTFRRSTGIDIGVASDFKLLDRAALDALLTLREYDTFFRGLSAWVGFKRTAIPFTVQPRVGGHSKWSVRSLFRLAVKSLTSYTSAPLFVVFWLGILTGVAALVMTVETLGMYFFGHAVSGFTTVILLLLFIGSAIMLSLSIIGLYLAKIYDEVKGRPRYLVQNRRGTAFSDTKTSGCSK